MRLVPTLPLLLALAACSSDSIVLQLADRRTGPAPPFVQARSDGGWLLLDTEGRILRFEPTAKPLPVLGLEAMGRRVLPSLVCEAADGSLYAAVPERSATAVMKFDPDGGYLQTLASPPGTALALLALEKNRLVLVTLGRSSGPQVHLFVDDLLFRTVTLATDRALRSVHPLPEGRLLLESETASAETFEVLDLRNERIVPFRMPSLPPTMTAGVLASGRLVLVEPTGRRRLRVHIVGPDGVERTFLRRVRPFTLSGRLLDPVCPVGDRLFELRLSPGRLRLIPLP